MSFENDKRIIESAGEAFIKDVAKEIERVRRVGKRGGRGRMSGGRLARKYGLSEQGFMPLDYILGHCTLGDITFGGEKQDALVLARKVIEVALNPVQIATAPF